MCANPLRGSPLCIAVKIFQSVSALADGGKADACANRGSDQDCKARTRHRSGAVSEEKPKAPPLSATACRPMADSDTAQVCPHLPE